MGKSESTQCYSNWTEARQAHDLGSRPKENRGGTEGKVGEGEGGEEVGCSEANEPAASLRVKHKREIRAFDQERQKEIEVHVTAQCILRNLPNWIQALAAMSIVGLTLVTLIVLKHYAADTKTIARASVSQLETSQMPFLAVIMRPNTTHSNGGWGVENQGFGPAINVTYSRGRREGHNMEAWVNDQGIRLKGLENFQASSTLDAILDKLKGADPEGRETHLLAICR
jgi:hypothetical protein